MAGSYPLNFLRVLPNMIASHISIIHDARGPNNTIHQNEASSLLAIGEAAAVIERGAADVMLAGGASSQMTPCDCVRRSAMRLLSPRQDDPAAVMRPFDAGRDGQVWGEGAAVFVLESRRSGRIAWSDNPWASAQLGFRLPLPSRRGKRSRRRPAPGNANRPAASRARRPAAGARQRQGLSTVRDDPVEAEAIRDVAPNVPVTAPRSFFGSLGAAGGAVETAASVLSFCAGLTPPTLNYERPIAACPLPIVRGEPAAASGGPVLAVNWTAAGQAVCVVLAGPA